MKNNNRIPVPKEKAIHQAVCDYIKYQYPSIIFFSDASGLRVSMGLRMELKRKRCSNYVIPDLIILHPSGTYHGLLIELKKNRSEVYYSNGDIKANDEHIYQQWNTLNRLEGLHYKAVFGCGFDETKKIIDSYLN